MPTIPIVVAAPTGKFVDTDCKLTETLLDALANRDILGIFRYVPLPGVDPKGDIDAAELELILAHPAKFCSGFVQHPRFPGWRPSAWNPETDAKHAVAFARAAGYPSGVHGFVDAEGMNPATTWQEAQRYNTAYSHVMVEEGYKGGLYDGYSEPETPEELYEIPDVSSYWSDLAKRKVAKRGTAVVQGPQFELLGVPFDPDDVAPDLLGDTPMVVRAA